jgi:hypothetical protein
MHKLSDYTVIARCYIIGTVILKINSADEAQAFTKAELYPGRYEVVWQGDTHQ